MKHKHLSYEQRYAIECMLKNKYKKKAIIATLELDESTFYRELKRNSKARSYNAKHAQILADERKKSGHYKSHFTKEMEKIIRLKMTSLQFSPEQIVGWCKLNGIKMVSHERIYQFIWADKQQGGLLYKELRTGQKIYRKRYGSKDNRGQIPNKKSIDNRPMIVEEKERIGDFEIDLIIGVNHQGALLTVVERKTSFVIIIPLKSKSSEIVEKAIFEALLPYKQWAKTITSDNGKEFYNHEKIAKRLEIDYYFAHPYSSWERGLNEYTNKLIRQYFPKKMELNNLNLKNTMLVMNKLNNRPRKNLNFKTPNQLLSNYIYKN